MALLREYTMGDRPIQVELLSDPDEGKADGFSCAGSSDLLKVNSCWRLDFQQLITKILISTLVSPSFLFTEITTTPKVLARSVACSLPFCRFFRDFSTYRKVPFVPLMSCPSLGCSTIWVNLTSLLVTQKPRIQVSR
jgi:hypothetical protein